MNRFNKSIQRMRTYYLRGGVWRILSFFIYKKNRVVYSCDIPPQTDMGDVSFMHKGFGVVINPIAHIGDGTVIQHGVTVGTLKTDSDVPYIGTNCFIGAKATLLGNIRLDDNCKIGACSLVINDVKAGSTVVGVPAKEVRFL